MVALGHYYYYFTYRYCCYRLVDQAKTRYLKCRIFSENFMLERKLYDHKYKNMNFYFLDNAAEADEEDPKLTADQTQAATNADDEFETVQDSGEKQVSKPLGNLVGYRLPLVYHLTLTIGYQPNQHPLVTGYHYQKKFSW